MLVYIDYISKKMSPVLKYVDYTWDIMLCILGILILIAIFLTSLYSIIAHLIVKQDVLYTSIVWIFIIFFILILYNYQWKRYKTMMDIQHTIRTKWPKLHKVIFLGFLDWVVLKIRAIGLFVISCLIIIYLFVVVIALFLDSMLNFNPEERDLSLKDRYGDGYIVPMVISFLLIFYWGNKVIFALVFWLAVLVMLLVLWLIYSIYYCFCAQKRILRENEEERRRNAQARYEIERGRDEEGNADISSSESSENNNLLRRLMTSMRKTFRIKNKKKGNSVVACSICFEAFQNNSIIIQLKWSDQHIFHEACFYSWARRNDTWPLWRKEIDESNDA